VKDKKVIRNSQYGFTKAKSFLTNLTTFYNELSGLVDKGREMDIVNVDFSKAFNALSSLLS